ncbi:hypothetical protein CMUS01_07545, partial [Colletotrichum musicola]
MPCPLNERRIGTFTVLEGPIASFPIGESLAEDLPTLRWEVGQLLQNSTISATQATKGNLNLFFQNRSYQLPRTQLFASQQQQTPPKWPGKSPPSIAYLSSSDIQAARKEFLCRIYKPHVHALAAGTLTRHAWLACNVPQPTTSPVLKGTIKSGACFASEGIDTFTWGPLAIYLHPEFSHRKLRHRRYRRSDDVYSLGVLLSEVALWEPAGIFVQDTDVFEASKRMLEVMKAELASEVGETYRDAVLACLEG